MKINKKLLLVLIIPVLSAVFLISVGKNLLPVKNFKIEPEYNKDKLDLDFANVVAAEGEKNGSVWTVSVTVLHNDTGWDHYADRWQIIDPETKEILAERILLHPHENEQPFKRSLGNIKFPADQKAVIIRASCTKHGFGGQEIMVFLVQDDAAYKILDNQTTDEED